MVREYFGDRYQLISPLGPVDASTAPRWQTFLARDIRLRRSVVLRFAVCASGDTRDLHERVHQAMRAARLNAYLVAHVYDAIIDGDATASAPPATRAIIIGEYFDGPTLRTAIEDGVAIDRASLLAALTHRVADAADANVSFGALRPEQIVLTQDGPAIAALPVGTLNELGPTSLDALAAELSSGRLTRTLRRLRGARRTPAHSR